MASYFASVFSDLGRQRSPWGRIPRDAYGEFQERVMRLADALATRQRCRHRNFQGDGPLVVYESADAAMQFRLKLIEQWDSGKSRSSGKGRPHDLPLHLGCHFGDVMRLDGGDAWIGRSIDLARRIAGAADAGSLLVTENVIDASDAAMYQFQQTGLHALEGDIFPERTLYRIIPSPQKAPGSI